MLRKIDIQKSIGSNRIYFTEGRIENFIYFSIVYFLLVFLLPFMSIRYEVINFKDLSNDIMSMFFSIFVPLLISVIVALFIYERKRLIRLSEIDRKTIIKAAKELDWSIEYDETDFIIIEAGYYLYQISIIFDNKDLLVHSLRYSPRARNIFTYKQRQLNIFMDKVKEIETRKIKVANKD